MAHQEAARALTAILEPLLPWHCDCGVNVPHGGVALQNAQADVRHLARISARQLTRGWQRSRMNRPDLRARPAAVRMVSSSTVQIHPSSNCVCAGTSCGSRYAVRKIQTPEHFESRRASVSKITCACSGWAGTSCASKYAKHFNSISNPSQIQKVPASAAGAPARRAPPGTQSSRRTSSARAAGTWRAPRPQTPVAQCDIKSQHNVTRKCANRWQSLNMKCANSRQTSSA